MQDKIKYQIIFENSTIPIVIMNAKTFIYTDCNTAAVKIYNYDTKKDILGKNILDFSARLQYDKTPSDSKVKEYINHVITYGSVEFDWLYQYKNGETWDARVHLMRLDINNEIFLQFSLFNISQKKRDDAEKGEYQTHLEKLVKERTEKLESTNAELLATNEKLEKTVAYRTAEMKETNEQLAATITELLQKINALNESENRYFAMVNNIMYSVVVSTYEGEVLFLNRIAGVSLKGNDENTAKINTLDFWVNVEQRKSFLIELKQNGSVHNFETQLQNKKDKKSKVVTIIMSSTLIDYYGQKAILTVFNDITKLKELEQKILTTTIDTEETERQRFAQELHDGIGPLLSAIKMYLQWIGKDMGKPNIPYLLGKTLLLVDDAHKTTREISHRLSPHILQNFGFVAALKYIAEQTQLAKKLIVNISSEFDNLEATFMSQGMQVQTIIYRVVSECITNTIKHAQAGEININAQLSENKLEITYTDNGLGFDTSLIEKNKNGIGLFNMKNRIEAINGTFLLQSFPNEGTKISFSIPMVCDVSNIC